ncbi:hypothetical protein [Kitasatospora sp. NPDC089509]|uniref:hypothetical protein n=1 Tax=Kitasatospora sp. NPDC089509 TaxID=3364079 RepID=UPI00381CD03B
MVPLWERRTYGNKRVALLETPVYDGASLRELLPDRHLPGDPLFDMVPHDPRLVALLGQLAPADLSVVLAFGHPGVVTWADAAQLAGSTQPDKDGETVRRRIRRTVAELGRREQQRADGSAALWCPGGAQC